MPAADSAPTQALSDSPGNASCRSGDPGSHRPGCDSPRPGVIPGVLGTDWGGLGGFEVDRERRSRPRMTRRRRRPHSNASADPRACPVWLRRHGEERSSSASAAGEFNAPTLNAASNDVANSAGDHPSAVASSRASHHHASTAGGFGTGCVPAPSPPPPHPTGTRTRTSKSVNRAITPTLDDTPTAAANRTPLGIVVWPGRGRFGGRTRRGLGADRSLVPLAGPRSGLRCAPDPNRAATGSSRGGSVTVSLRRCDRPET